MADGRIPLKTGYQLLIDKERNYVIEKVIGRGGSCLVYEASYRDRVGKLHKVRLKECCPYLLNLSRNADGGLLVPEQMQPRMEEAKQSFLEAYKKGVDLRNTEGLANATADATNIYEVNNTLYSAMEYTEGEEYQSYMEKHPEEDLHSFLNWLVTLTKIIGRYHANGLLHLDIKPENMLLIFEPEKSMLLFDFDPIIAEEDLWSGKKLNISFSDGFSAPEQVSGKVEEIGRHTDIYAIGAMVFWKLFGRKPNAIDNRLWAKYDCESMLNRKDEYQPILFRKLDEFLHKTIVGATNKRWQNIEEVRRALEELVELSDTEKVFLCDNFNYNFDGFVGRARELEDLKAQVEEKRVVFLSGIGGIGKTELAKRYAFENRNSFRTVVFAPFAGSIADTVCGEDFNINKCDQAESMSTEEYFAYKWKTLKGLVREDDLIILDNFDVEQDENLGRFIEELPCRLIITTREDFSDRNLLQISVERMEKEEDLLRLFETNNEREYTEEETEALKKIIELVDGHTMTVTLIAKYLRDSEESPESLYEKLQVKEGISGVDEVQIEHAKDKKAKTESIYTHLLSLFNMSSFTEQEKELIMSLSLFGFVRIKKKKFLAWCDVEDSKEALRHLVKRGWIQSDKKSGKIALHQIILDMVYNHLQPTSEKCPHVVVAMLRYMEEDLQVYGQQRNRLKLLMDILERIQGADENYFKLMVAGCRMFFEWNMDVNVAKRVPVETDGYLNKLVQGLERESHWKKYPEVRMQCEVLRIQSILGQVKKKNSEEVEKENISDELNKCIVAGKRVLSYEKNWHVSTECKVKNLWDMAAFLRTVLYYLGEDILKEHQNMTDKLLFIVKKGLNKIEKYIGCKELDQWKEEYYEVMEYFYAGHGFKYGYGSSLSSAYMRPYRSAEKVIYYQKKQKKKDIDSLIEVWGEFARDDMRNEEYSGGLRLLVVLYPIAKLQFWGADYRLQRWENNIAECYEKLEKCDKAIGFLQQLDRRKELDEDSYALLVRLLEKEERWQEAEQYAERDIEVLEKDLATNMQRQEQEPENRWTHDRIIELKERQLIALVQKYKLAEDEFAKKQVWKKCLFLYKELAPKHELLEKHLYGERKSGIFEFYQLYLQQLLLEKHPSKKSIKLQIDIYLFLLRNYEDKEDQKEYLKALYEKIADKYRERVVEDEYLKHYLLYLELQSMSKFDIGTDEEFGCIGKECDFYLLAEHHSEGIDNEKKMMVWEGAEWRIEGFEKYEVLEQCYAKQLSLLEPVFGLLNAKESAAYWRASEETEGDKDDVEKNCIYYFWNRALKHLDNILRLNEYDKIAGLVQHFYEMLIQYYCYELFTKEDEEEWQETFLEWKRWDRRGHNGEDILYETHNQEFARRVANLSYYLRTADSFHSGAIIASIAVYISLTEEPDKEFLRAVYPEQDGSMELLVTKVSKKLKQNADQRFVPVACERIERILTWFPDDEDLQPLKQSMESFLARYQEMEFKE